jgi:hypothetical protein
MARGSGAAWLSGELRWQLPVEASPIRCLDARLLDSYNLDVANKPACWLFVGFKARVSVTLPRALDHPAHLVQCENSTLCSSVGRLPHGRAVARSYKNTSGILMPSPESVFKNGRGVQLNAPMRENPNFQIAAIERPRKRNPEYSNLP